MRRNGVEIACELLGDEARNIGELRVGVFEDGNRRRPTKGARLQRDSGEVIMELVDVQVDAIKASRMVIKGIERRQTERGVVEFAQAWLCVQAVTPLLETSRERFFKNTGDPSTDSAPKPKLCSRVYNLEYTAWTAQPSSNDSRPTAGSWCIRSAHTTSSSTRASAAR